MKIGNAKNHSAIIIGVCGIIASVLAALVTVYFTKIKEYQIQVYLLDAENQKQISGTIYIDGNQEGNFINAEWPASTIELKRGRRVIKVESGGYYTRDIIITKLTNPLSITLNPNNLVPLPMVGWNTWNEITISEGSKINECIINSNGRIPDAAGFVTTGITTDLQWKTLVLYFSNSNVSKFSEKRMVKLECNYQPKVLRPSGGIPMVGDYLAAMDTTPDRGIEFKIPDDFDGRINFVFYQAELNNLKITANYKFPQEF